MFTSHRHLAVLLVSSLGLASSPALRAAPVVQDDCADGSAAGAWKLPTVLAGHGLVLGRLVDPSDPRDTLRLRALLTDEIGTCTNCIQGSVHGYLDDGRGGPPRYEVEGTYEGTMIGDGTFDIRIHMLNGGPAIGEIRGEFASPRASGFHGRFQGDWRIC